jgi:hypothetical protein
MNYSYIGNLKYQRQQKVIGLILKAIAVASVGALWFYIIFRAVEIWSR